MQKLLSIAGALMFAVSTAMANAPPPPNAAPAPEFVVKGIYDTKLEADAVSPEFGAAMTDSLILRHFSPELLALFKSTFHADEPVINGDVFMMSQEWAPTDVATRAVSQDGDAATVEASFKIAGEDRTVTLTLKRAGARWEIDDISDGRGSIRQWIAEDAAP